MRDPSRFRHHAGGRCNRRRRLCQRRSGGRCASKSGCAATSAGSRTIRPARTRRPRAGNRPIDAPSYVIAAPENDDDEEAREFNPVIIAEVDHVAEAALGQRGGDGTRPDRRRRSWCSGTLDMAASIWSTAAPTATSAGSIRPQLTRPRPIDGVALRPYGPPPLRRAATLSSRISGKIPCRSPISSRPMRSFRR